ncbi:acyl-CoA thioesterase [Geoglobus acetivorans]|uniref:4-hydroxybenzoyl-CoA thioesterase n=1 Tax=Geoglobus acetivorans TaxID=565033 RepID=A0A0A7GFV5_GEOAI|nr:4-hydroxybenzoyl-CoA thioesterase [Geoglobus acetivorans]
MKFEIEIWFGDLDAYGHVNNAVFARFLETARVKFFRERFGKVEPTFVLRRIEIDFISPMFLGETAVVEMGVGEIGNTSWEFVYTIREKKTGREVLRARTIQVWVDLKENKKIPIPDGVKKVLEAEKVSP